jgi:hypothetical protein
MWTFLLSLMTPRVWIALGLSVVLCGTHWKAYVAGENNIREEVAQDNITRARGMLKLVERAQEAQASIQAAADKQTEVDHAQNVKLVSERDAALESLRVQRKSRPAGYMPPTPAVAASSPSCSAATLYADDSAVVVRLAAAHDQLRLDLIGCQNRYNAAKTQIDAMRK